MNKIEEKRFAGQSYRPIAIVHKAKRGIPTVLQIEGNRYILDSNSHIKSNQKRTRRKARSEKYDIPKRKTAKNKSEENS